MDYINAFWVGGLICALVQILLDRTKLMPGRVMVLLVCIGAFLGAIGVYGPFQEFAGGGRVYRSLVLAMCSGKGSGKLWMRTDSWRFIYGWFQGRSGEGHRPP